MEPKKRCRVPGKGSMISGHGVSMKMSVSTTSPISISCRLVSYEMTPPADQPPMW